MLKSATARSTGALLPLSALETAVAVDAVVDDGYVEVVPAIAYSFEFAADAALAAPHVMVSVIAVEALPATVIVCVPAVAEFTETTKAFWFVPAVPNEVPEAAVTAPIAPAPFDQISVVAEDALRVVPTGAVAGYETVPTPDVVIV